MSHNQLTRSKGVTAKLLSLSVLLLTLFIVPVKGEIVNYTDPWNDPGFNLLSFDGAGVDVTYSLTQYALEDIMIDGQQMQAVYLPGVIIPNNAGAPNLPGYGRFIAIPQGARASVEIVDYRTEVLQGIELAPAAPIPLDTDDSPPVYRKDPTIYERNAYYPEQPVMLSEVTDIRGVDVVILGITPFQYNPVTKELVIFRDLEVRVSYIGGSGHFGEDRLRSRLFEPVLKGNLLNYSQLPQVNLIRTPQQTDEDNVEYLIIVPDDPVFLAWADTLKQWRSQQGIITGITTLTEIGGNNSTLIENYINNAYNNWDIPPAAILLLSDYQSSGADIYGITSPMWSNYCVSDNIYADVNGNDLPDMIHARIAAQNYNQLSRTIGKMLTYERTPPTDPGFYQHPITAGGWQTDRWFILCAEVCWGFMHYELGKDPVREYAIYSGTPGTQWSSNGNTYMIVNYFGPTGLQYIPNTPAYLTDWGGNAARINNDINQGAFLMLHRDHGMETGWGEPSYNNSSLAGLTNDEYPFVFSINCLTGKYNWSGECFSEAFHRMEHGALGLTAASEVSYSFVNDTYVWGMWDAMWPNFDPGYGADLMGSTNLQPAFANVSGKYYLAASSWPYNPQNKAHTNNLFHHHGDAFITMYSQVPQNLTVSHAGALLGGASEFTVTANDGAIISLTVNNQIIGVAEATGAPVPIAIAPQVPGANMLVTVTLQNYYRYMQVVPVVPPVGPYVICNNVTINDAGGWIPNGQLDFGENVLLNATVENIGVAIAPGVTATIETADIYTTIIDNNAVFGDVQANSTVTVNNAFEISVSDDIPNEHNITFTMLCTSGDSAWSSSFALTAYAPIIAFEELEISDPTGNNNGQLDPGETADFMVTLSNSGGTVASNLQSALSTSEPLITIPTATATLASLAAGAQATVTYTGIIADASMPLGSDVDFGLDITADGNYAVEDGFSVLVGDIRYQPTGPDQYGYWAYDMYDAASVSYDWVEIAPAAGGPGQIQTYSDDQTRQFNLPFTFMYYGASFTQISVCSNGWVAMGYTTSTDYTNSQIPAADGPPNMIAGLWDDLYPPSGGQIATYYDVANHRYIVEWYQIPHITTGGPETFQIILLDPAYFFSPTGDGNILVNYHTIVNFASATIGIENAPQTVGIQFAYNGTYDLHAMPVENNFAIMYTTGLTMPEVSVTATPQGTPIVIPPAGGTFTWDVLIQNIGTNFATFSAWTNVTMPDSSIYGPILLRTGLGLPPGGSITRNLTQSVPSVAPTGEYTYNVYVGGYPGNIIDEDHFNFTKSAGDNTAASQFNDWNITGWDEGGEIAVNTLPDAFYLSQNYPNPFNPVTNINFSLPEDGIVKLEVFNIMGQKVAVLLDGKMDAGFHSIVWNAYNMSSGVYFYKISAGEYSSIRKCVLMK